MILTKKSFVVFAFARPLRLRVGRRWRRADRRQINVAVEAPHRQTIEKDVAHARIAFQSSRSDFDHAPQLQPTAFAFFGKGRVRRGFGVVVAVIRHTNRFSKATSATKGRCDSRHGCRMPHCFPRHATN